MSPRSPYTENSELGSVKQVHFCYKSIQGQHLMVSVSGTHPLSYCCHCCWRKDRHAQASAPFIKECEFHEINYPSRLAAGVLFDVPAV